MHFRRSRADGISQDAVGQWCSAQGKPTALEKHQLGLHQSGSLNFLLEGGLPPLCPTKHRFVLVMCPAPG